MSKKKKPANKFAVIYARYSSHQQKDLSIDQQVAACRKLASELGVEIIDIYADRAISGKTDRRPEFQRMMADATLGKFGYLLAWKSNRIGRNMYEAMYNLDYLRSLGVSINYVEENFGGSASGLFAERTMMNVNQFYLESMSEDIIRGMKANAEKCLMTNGHLPLGYKAGPDLTIVLDEKNAPVVREIFERVVRGDTFAELAEDLNRRGFRSSLNHPFTKNSFYTILKNERYRGIYIYDDIRIEGGLPRIIPDDLFLKVQTILEVGRKTKRRKTNGINEYLLTGKLFCGVCESMMTGSSGYSKTGKIYRYYSCPEYRADNCDNTPVPRDLLELAISEAIRNVVIQPDVIDWICDSVEEYQKRELEKSAIPLMEEQLAETQAAIEELWDGIIHHTVEKEYLNEKFKLLFDKRDQLRQDIEFAKMLHKPMTRQSVHNFMTSYVRGDIHDREMQKAFIDSFLTKAYVFPDRKIKLILDMYGNKNTELTLSDLVGDAADACSYKLSIAPPTTATANSYDLALISASLIISFAVSRLPR